MVRSFSLSSKHKTVFEEEMSMLTFSTKNKDYTGGGYGGLMVAKAWLSSQICVSPPSMTDQISLSLYVLFLPITLHCISL